MNTQFFLSSFKASATDWNSWRWQLKNRVTGFAPLKRLLGNVPSDETSFKKVAAVYPMAITPYYLSLIRDNHFSDPICAQSIPRSEEISCGRLLPEDPLEEDLKMPVPKLIHRYPDRCLAMVTEACAVYCRHCNRKRFWSTDRPGSLKKRWQIMLDYLASARQIREVIISGGDPLTLEDAVLDKLLSSLRSLPHIEILRIGSRTPVVMPMRITRDLCRILKRHRPLWFNTQFNHPAEITPEAARACNRLQEAGIPVSNQSVLLKGVNDLPEVMKALLNGLQKISVRPYYLFHCDPARGCAHFRTDLTSGMALMEAMRRQCSGLCLPQYVVDTPGRAGKIPLNALSRTIQNDLKKNKHFFDKFT
ncbi:MAG TPA: KamA family radical SAM protein [Smithella sp.]|nr:KamA family radical SAM protein [Smithella sp.]HRS97995.1 KamA family radical SAM protein [Smithella sp.]